MSIYLVSKKKVILICHKTVARTRELLENFGVKIDWTNGLCSYDNNLAILVGYEIVTKPTLRLSNFNL